MSKNNKQEKILEVAVGLKNGNFYKIANCYNVDFNDDHVEIYFEDILTIKYEDIQQFSIFTKDDDTIQEIVRFSGAIVPKVKRDPKEEQK